MATAEGVEVFEDTIDQVSSDLHGRILLKREQKKALIDLLLKKDVLDLSTNQIAPFSSCSHEAFGIENLHRAHKYRLFSYCYALFFGNFTRYYFYNSESTHWNGILKGRRYFPVYFDFSL
jgi:hypothetical protein